MTEKPASVSRRYYVGIASVFFAAALSASSAVAGGWETFVKRCVTPMQAGGVPLIVGLDLVEGDPVGQAFDLPGEDRLVIRPPFGDFGTQCLVMTKTVDATQADFGDWAVTAIKDGRYAPDAQIDGRYLSDGPETPLAMDIWQEGDVMMLQLSFLERGS